MELINQHTNLVRSHVSKKNLFHVEHWQLYWIEHMNEKWKKQKRNCFTTCAVIMLAPATKAENIIYIIHYRNAWSLPVILVFVAALVCYIAYLPAVFCEAACLCKLHHFYLWYIKSYISYLWVKVARAKHWPHTTRLFCVRSILLVGQIFMTIYESNDILHVFLGLHWEWNMMLKTHWHRWPSKDQFRACI
jgi:hypothetical protein